MHQTLIAFKLRGELREEYIRIRVIIACLSTHKHTPLPFNIIIAAPSRKKRKLEKKSKSEKAVEKAIDSFVQYQREAEERFLKYEDERWKKEIEVEEKRRREEKEHELRILQMLGQAFRRDHRYEFNTAGHDEYDF